MKCLFDLPLVLDPHDQAMINNIVNLHTLLHLKKYIYLIFEFVTFII